MAKHYSEGSSLNYKCIWVKKNAPIVEGQESYLRARGSDRSDNPANID